MVAGFPPACRPLPATVSAILPIYWTFFSLLFHFISSWVYFLFLPSIFVLSPPHLPVRPTELLRVSVKVGMNVSMVYVHSAVLGWRDLPGTQKKRGREWLLSWPVEDLVCQPGEGAGPPPDDCWLVRSRLATSVREWGGYFLHQVMYKTPVKID